MIDCRFQVGRKEPRFRVLGSCWFPSRPKIPPFIWPTFDVSLLVVRAWSLHLAAFPKLRALRIRRARGFDGIGRFPSHRRASHPGSSITRKTSLLSWWDQPKQGKKRAKCHLSAFFGRDSEWTKSNKEVTSKTLKRVISATCPEL